MIEKKKFSMLEGLTDDPLYSLEDLSKKYKISRERVRQIENKAFEKVQKHMLNFCPDQKIYFLVN